MNNKEVKNSQLTQEIKGLLSNVIDYLEQDETLTDLKNALTTKMTKLENFQVKRESGYVQPEPLVIEEKEEEIIATLGKEQDVDYRHFLLVEIIANSMKNQSPALKKGLASLLVNNSNHTLEDFSLSEEENVFNLLSYCYGLSRMIDFVINNENAFSTGESSDLQNIIALMDYNYQYRKKAQKSNYAQIQKAIIDAFGKRDDLDEQKLANFQLNLCSDAKFMSETGCEYPDLASVEEHFQKVKQNVPLQKVETVKLG